MHDYIDIRIACILKETSTIERDNIHCLHNQHQFSITFTVILTCILKSRI